MLHLLLHMLLLLLLEVLRVLLRVLLLLEVLMLLERVRVRARVHLLLLRLPVMLLLLKREVLRQRVVLQVELVVRAVLLARAAPQHELVGTRDRVLVVSRDAVFVVRLRGLARGGGGGGGGGRAAAAPPFERGRATAVGVPLLLLLLLRGVEASLRGRAARALRGGLLPRGVRAQAALRALAAAARDVVGGGGGRVGDRVGVGREHARDGGQLLDTDLHLRHLRAQLDHVPLQFALPLPLRRRVRRSLLRLRQERKQGL